MKQYDVVSICNALVDVLVKVDDTEFASLNIAKGVMHLVDAPRQSEVLEKFRDHKTTTELGGSSMNAIRTLAALGAKTSFVGAIGEDEFGQLIASRMEQLGINPQLGKRQEATGTCLVLITPDGERTMNTNLGASRLLTPDMVPTDVVKQAQVFHFCGYQWDTDDQIKTIQEAIKVAKSAGVKVSFDVADPFVIQRHKEAFLDLIAQDADIVFANKEEAKMLFGCDPEQAARKVAETGALAVIKQGGDGAIIAKGSEVVRVPVVPTTVVDTTAAGDMFAAGFLYGFTRGKDLATCGKAAATVASDVISRVGATVAPEALEAVKKV